MTTLSLSYLINCLKALVLWQRVESSLSSGPEPVNNRKSLFFSAWLGSTDPLRFTPHYPKHAGEGPKGSRAEPRGAAGCRPRGPHPCRPGLGVWAGSGPARSPTAERRLGPGGGSSVAPQRVNAGGREQPRDDV